MARIVVIEHELQRGLDLPYMVNTFAERWCALGHEVVRHYGTDNPPPGDLAILHVDLSVTPPEYRALAGRYSKVINGRVHDISKRRFSQLIVASDDPWAGPVIVKTDANFGGQPEQMLRARAAQRGLASDIEGGPVATRYPIYPSLRDVPATYWNAPGLIVEKFVPERDAQGHYCVRVWTFFGSGERNSIWRATDPIVKAGSVIERKPEPILEPVRAWREKLGFDFGKFDYVQHAGRAILLDVNRTPSFPATDSHVLHPVADGIAAYL